MNVALILAGGTGSRVGFSIPKQFISIEDEPILVHTIRRFQRHPEVDAIAVVCVSGWEDTVRQYVRRYQFTKLCWVFTGETTGFGSIRRGLGELVAEGVSGDSIILIHDGVRPLVSQEIITANIAACKSYRYAITAIPCVEAILESPNGLDAVKSVPRHTLFRTQTPQTFRLKDILEIHEEARVKGIGDSISSCTLIAELGNRTMHLVEGDASNIKVTTQADLKLVKVFLYLMQSGSLKK